MVWTLYFAFGQNAIQTVKDMLEGRETVEEVPKEPGNQRQGGECVFASQLGEGGSQEEVQKKPQLGTTQ
jgi:hypothetical protein